jgi:hypothetical protein
MNARGIVFGSRYHTPQRIRYGVLRAFGLRECRKTTTTQIQRSQQNPILHGVVAQYHVIAAMYNFWTILILGLNCLISVVHPHLQGHMREAISEAISVCKKIE